MFIILQYFVLCTKIVINKNLQQIYSCGCVLHCIASTNVHWPGNLMLQSFTRCPLQRFAICSAGISHQQIFRLEPFEAQAQRDWCNRWVRKISEVAVILPKLRGESIKRRKELIFKKETVMFRAKSSNWVVRKNRIYHVYNESITVCVDLIIYREP